MHYLRIWMKELRRITDLRYDGWYPGKDFNQVLPGCEESPSDTWPHDRIRFPHITNMAEAIHANNTTHRSVCCSNIQ